MVLDGMGGGEGSHTGHYWAIAENLIGSIY